MKMWIFIIFLIIQKTIVKGDLYCYSCEDCEDLGDLEPQLCQPSIPEATSTSKTTTEEETEPSPPYSTGGTWGTTSIPTPTTPETSPVTTTTTGSEITTSSPSPTEDPEPTEPSTEPTEPSTEPTEGIGAIVFSQSGHREKQSLSDGTALLLRGYRSISLHGFRTPTYACITITVKGDDENDRDKVNRGCIEVPSGKTGCEHYVEQNHLPENSTENCYECFEDRCNGSASIRNSMLAVLFMAALGLLHF